MADSNSCRRIILWMITSQLVALFVVYVRYVNIYTSHTINVQMYGNVSFASITTSTNHGLIPIAIGMGITSAKLRKLSYDNLGSKMAFFHSFLPSFCKTCSAKYNYTFFLAHDYSDSFYGSETSLKDFERVFERFVSKNCPNSSFYHLRFVNCSHQHKPAWAQNDAMIEAYLSGMEYFYRINDDTVLNTAGWTEIFIRALNVMAPSKVGVVGPHHKGGNTGILTYDFTHRTHMNVFGFYYPRVFPNWYADDWITEVYKPGRSVKLRNVSLLHTQENGKRYSLKYKERGEINKQIEADKQTVIRYVIARDKQVTPNPRQVISMPLVSTSRDHMIGILRNAQLLPVIYPDWSLHVYTPTAPTNATQRVIDALTRLGVKVALVESTNIPLSALHYLVADDPDVETFLIRDPSARISEREATAVSDWLTHKNGVHCMRDHKEHLNHPIVDGLWGAKTKQLRNHLGKTSMKELLVMYESNNTQSFLDKVLWSKVEDDLLYHDSITCTNRGSNVLTFPIKRSGISFIGQRYDEHEEKKLTDLKSINTICNTTRSS